MISGLAWETSDGSAKLPLNTTGLYHTQRSCGLWLLPFMLVWSVVMGTYLKAKVQPQPWTAPVPVGLALQNRALRAWWLFTGKQGASLCSWPTPHRLSLCRYLKEFRTEQCPLFVQHKCTQHRPYTCFHWHFVNQRRRRSIRRRDGTFNYSPDVYCTKYDEATGLCPEGDE